MRLHRPKYSELSEDQKKKSNARSMANSYQVRGLLIQQPCKVCGDPNSEKHHIDYDKPLKVEWYCRNHHLALHHAA